MKNRHVSEKFYNDPEWGVVEEILMDKINQLRDMDEIDDTKHPDEVKAELKGRKKAYQLLLAFLGEAKLIGQAPTKTPTFR